MHSGYKSLDNFLAKYSHFIISTHESPDWDGLGAEIAFNELLRQRGKQTMILNSDPTPESFLTFFDPEEEIKIYRGPQSLPECAANCAHFVLDTNEYTNIGSAHGALSEMVQDVFIIDHHEGSTSKFESNFIKVEASSACEIVYEIYQYYDLDISLKAARALFAGVVFDTGSFRYPKTSPGTFRMAAHLVDLGVSPTDVYEKIYEQNSRSSFRLRSMILSTMEILYGGRLIAMKLTPEMLAKSGATFTEGEPAINLPLTVKGVAASLLVKQESPGHTVKVSMRTKGDFDVAEIAMKKGGGGHKNAAGFKSNLPFDETYETSKTLFEPFFK
ncbi:MAG: bifunctional oligoribonuclease/PAP phosphatase NrnA [Spirochaetes bacterium]|nr:bifunctional oligoribonuclease/PAP phosphatase NrnA [Spirochaetota bacterium]